jgi:hypothetical protein
LVIWWIQTRIDAGAKPNVAWQLLAYVLLTSSEVMVSITGLEFSYTQAPSGQLSFDLASSGLLCSELRSPQRIKTPATAATKKAIQSPNQTFLQKIGKSSMVANTAHSKKSSPASVEIAILINTVWSSIIEPPLESKTWAGLNELREEYNISLRNRDQRKASFSLIAI